MTEVCATYLPAYSLLTALTVKDMIIRGGENIVSYRLTPLIRELTIMLPCAQASVSVEDALYHDERLAEVAAVGLPDEKLGELVAAVVSTKPAYHGKVTETELLDLARKRSVRCLSWRVDKHLTPIPTGYLTLPSLS